MKFKTRYRFWQVLLGFICFVVIIAIIYYIAEGTLNHEPVSQKPVSQKPKGKPLPGAAIRAPLALLFFVVFFYFSANYYYNLLAANKKIFAYLKVTIFVIAGSFLYNCLLYAYFPGALLFRYKSVWDILSVMVRNMIPLFIFCYLFAYVTILREALKQKRILEAQKLLLEAQISQANFNFLKSQINPHFLHNTLNFLYAKSLPYSEELSEGILTLSDMMRYALDQGYQREGKAPLKDEVEHVHNVIKISQLRFSNQLSVSIEVSGNLDQKMIVPFVLITIVENAFKHGDLKDPDHPITIKLNVKANNLYFYCNNKKRSGPKQLSTGIGLENIKQRLELAYGNQFKFIVKDEVEFYTTELTIEEL